METVAQFLARTSANANTAKAEAANIVIGSVAEKPDEVAGDLQLATEFAKTTGKPVPPLSMVQGNRSIFQQQIEARRNSSILTTAPKLADWLRTPQNAAVAKDDIQGLSWWEGMGKAIERGGRRVAASPDVMGATVRAGLIADIGKTQDQLFQEEIQKLGAGYDPAMEDSARQNAEMRARNVEGMGQVEKDQFMREGANALAAARAAFDRVDQIPMSGAAAAFRDNEYKSADNSIGGTLAAFGANPAGGLAFLSETVAEFLPVMAAATAATAATSSPAAGAAVMGSGSFLIENATTAMDFLQKKGVDLSTPAAALSVLQNPDLMNEARSRGLERGVIIGLFDAVSGGIAGKTLAKSHVGNIAVQGIVQMLFGGGGELAAQGAIGDGVDWREVVMEGMGELMSAPMEVAGVGGKAFMNERGRAQAAENRKAVFTELSGQAVASKVRERMPDVFRDFVARATENGPVENVYVPAEDFVRYFQGKDIDPFELASSLDGVDADDLRAAYETGGDLRIPTATYAAKLAGSDHDAFLAENMRFQPDEMSEAQARAFNEGSQDALQDAFDEAEQLRREDERWQSYETDIYDTMVSRLRQSGRATDVATTEATLYPAFYRVMAERSGMTIDAFLERYPLPAVRGDVPAGMQMKNVDVLTRTLAEARTMKAASKPSGPSLLEFIAERGGVNDVGGELRSRDAAELKRRGKKTLRLARAEGGDVDLAGRRFGPDDVAQAAIEAGFLADDPIVAEYRAAMERGDQVPDIGAALWAGIDRELRGDRQASTEAEAPNEADAAAAQIEEYLAELGVTLDDADEVIRAAIEGDQTPPQRVFAQENRGQIAFPAAGVSSGESVISLFRSANLSTFIHESGHYFLTVMQDLSGRGEITSAEDFDAVKGWWRENAVDVARDANRVMRDAGVTADDVITALEAGTTGDLVKDAAVDVGMQEQFARAFEAYLMEGRAPSIALRTAFEKMRAWLLSIYKKLAGLNVKPSDELRNVFDRMLASDAEIVEARAEMGDRGADFATAEQLGLSDDDYALLVKLHDKARDDASARVLREAMAPIRRAATAAYKAEREAVVEEVTADLTGRPNYRAFEWMANRRWLGGDAPEGLVEMRLSKDDLTRRYGAGVLKTLPRGQFTVYAVEGGVDADYAAGVFGLSSGDELVRLLEQSPPRVEAIRAETERVMASRYNDPLKDGSIADEALAATHSDRKAQALALELKALNEIAGTDRGLTHKEAREIARQTLNRSRVKDARASARYLAAERKAGQEAFRLVQSVTRDKMWLDAAKRRVESTARRALKEGDLAPTVTEDGARTPLGTAIRDFNKRFETTSSTFEVGAQNRVSASGKAFTIPAGQRTSTSLGFNDQAAKLVEAKRRQLLNHMLYAEARAIDTEIQAAQDKIGKLRRPDAKLAKAVSIDHVKAARAIGAKFGLVRGDEQFDFDMWMQQLQFEDPTIAAAMSDAISTYANDAKPFKDLTVSEFRAVREAIDNVIETGRRYRTLEIEGAKIEREAAIAELTAVLRDRGIKENPAMQAKLKGIAKLKPRALSLLAGLRRMENWARDMDDGSQGAFTRYMVRPVMDAVGVYRVEKVKRLRQMLEIIDGRKDDLLGGAIAAPELGYTFENKGELLHAILHTGNESNLEKLLLGRGWSEGLSGQVQAVTPAGKPRVSRKTGQAIMTRGRVDTSKWDAFVSRMVDEGRLTKEDFDTAQSLWDLMEELKRPAQAAHKKMLGFYFQEIQASKIETPFGTYRGGYVPAIADGDASNDGQIRYDQNAMDAQQSSFMFPTTGKGFTKGRVKDYSTPLALNLMLLPAHMDKVLRFTHVEPTIRQTASIVTNRTFRSALDGFDQSIAGNLIVPWLQRTAQQAVEAQATTSSGRAMSSIVRALRNRVGVHTMFLNLVNTAQQVTGFSSAAVLVRPSRLKGALIRYSRGDADAMRAEAMEASPFMRDRIDTAGREAQQRIQDAIVKPTTASEMRAFIGKHGYFLQQVTQNVIDVVTWHGAYDQAVAAGMSEADASFEADSVVRRTMGDFSAENVSLFETGNAFTRLFTMFYSYFNGQANLVGGEMQTAMRTMGWNGKGRMFWVYLFGIGIPAIVGEMIVQAARGELGGDDDDDGYVDELSELFFGAQARYGLGMVPIAGQVTNALVNRFNDQFYDDRLSTSPVIPAIERVVGAPATIGAALTGSGTAKRAVTDGLTALGMITGIPTGQLAKTAGYLTGIAEGASKPEGVVDVVQGMASGRDGTEK